MANDPEMEAAARETGDLPAKRRRIHPLVALLIIVVVVDVLAFLFVPPFPRGGEPGDACAYPVCFINGTLEFPPPHVVWQIQEEPLPTGQIVIGFNVSITNTILTMWIVMAVVLLVCHRCHAGRCGTFPGRLQNVVEFAYETLRDFAIGPRGPGGGPPHPDLRLVLLADPVLQLERAHSAGRQGSRSSGRRRAT